MNDGVKDILVYLDTPPLDSPLLIGTLSCQKTRGREVFSFQCAPLWLEHPEFRMLDPDLGKFTGPQYLRDEKANFGLFLDSSPDRWGRLLIKRREALMARTEQRSRRTLSESDFLLGVYDETRMGALRFKLSEDGDFIDHNEKYSTPPIASLRLLEYACAQYEEGLYSNDTDEARWLKMIFAPGSSLGGARPKASVKGTDGSLWIAKFPRRNDDRDIGAWEMLAHILARRCGIEMADSRIDRFASPHHTFITRRFDRLTNGRRVHFASAMTMLGKNDGADATDGSSYLELVEFIITQGAEVEANLRQLWLRIVFSIAVSNCDDHLRNHGFLLSQNGWRLSPAYDINPTPDASGLKLNIDETDNSLDFNLAMDVAPYFRLKNEDAKTIIAMVRKAVADWPKVATSLGIPRAEQTYMAPAFKI